MGSIVLALWIGPRIRLIAEQHELKTVGDFLELRYGRNVRAITSLLLWMGSLAIPAGQLIAISTILNVVTGLPKYTGCLVGGGVVIVYFTAGGLLTSAWVNMVQLAVKLAGFAIALPLALQAIGGWSTVAQVQADNVSYWNPWHGGDSGWMYLALLGPAFIVSPGLLQKAYGARDERAVRQGIAWNGVGLLIFACAPAAIGLAAHALYPALVKPDLALPTILDNALPPAVGMIALAAVFSAEVSSADAVLFMLATSASRDLYRGFVRPGASEAEVLRVARLAAVAGSLCGVGVAMVYGSVRAAVGVFYAILTVTLFVPILGALFVRGAGRVAGLASLFTGVPVLVVTQYLSGGRGYGVLSPALAGVLASAAAFAAAHFLAPRSTAAPLDSTPSADKIPQEKERKGAT
jgi:SSS family solute:Na+ symporter